ncbi:MAG: ionic transporter y4hA [Parvularculaceae bacterium]
MTAAPSRIPVWTIVAPASALLVLGAAAFFGAEGVLAGLATAALIGAVFAAVFHAELIAHRVGEPFGTLILAVAVTIIEVGLIVSVMTGDPTGKAALARDTIFAVVMIVLNGVVGLCLLSGAVRHHEQGFQLQGASAALAVLAALTILTLVVPNVTSSAPGPYFDERQLIFAGAVSLFLYGAFIFVQTVRHRDYFLSAPAEPERTSAAPSGLLTSASAALLTLCLIAVVGLAKLLTPTVDGFIAGAGAPKAVVGIIIAAIVLLPESIAAVRAARADRLQTSLNLSLGSALASIGLTIPAVAGVSILLDAPLALGLEAKELILLTLTLFISVITLGTGRTTVLQGLVHLAIFATFVFLAFVP